MTPADLSRHAALLYGAQHVTPLAADLGVSRRLVHYWLRGERRIPAWVPERLDAIRRRKRSALAVPVIGS